MVWAVDPRAVFDQFWLFGIIDKDESCPSSDPRVILRIIKAVYFYALVTESLSPDSIMDSCCHVCFVGQGTADSPIFLESLLGLDCLKLDARLTNDSVHCRPNRNHTTQLQHLNEN